LRRPVESALISGASRRAECGQNRTFSCAAEFVHQQSVDHTAQAGKRLRNVTHEEEMMSLLRRLRGEPRTTLLLLGQTLTLYRQGSQLGLFVGLATFAAFNLPWHLIPAAGQPLQLLTAGVGSYFAATLMASRAPFGMDATDAAARWL
jgi:hypothetical protein